MTNLQEIINDKDFINFETIPSGEKSFEIVGIYPYSKKRIKGVKVPREVFFSVISLLPVKYRDNKMVVVVRDKVSFGTKDFAIFFHDYGCTLGSLSDIQPY